MNNNPANVFVGRSLCVIDDLSISERKYLFEQVRKLKAAIEVNDLPVMDTYRINDPDFGIYEVFLEDSTRTKESFRNAAKFHHVKVSELNSDSSSFNKGESFADTFNTLAGYSNTIFIIRSKIEGVCRWLEDECTAYANRNKLWRKPAFINAGDGKHEHPTQELLDEFTFLEDNNWSTDSIHVALVGDLFHGRTVHSKANGLKVFNHVKVDLIAPEELAMPEAYIETMKKNGFEVRIFPSIEKYLEQKDVAKKWYFTRPQLERMGDRILQRQEALRSTITFRKEFMDKVPEGTKFYHPLPRHKEHPTIPTYLDDTSLNGWERQSINGMYVRMILLALIGGRIGDDYVAPAVIAEKDVNDEEYIIEVPVSKAVAQEDKNYSEGVRPIRNGIVVDHICKGDSPSEIRDHMRLISSVIGLDDAKGGEWVSTGKEPGSYKGIIFRPGARELSRKELKRLAAVAPGCTLNIVKDGTVAAKYRTHMPPRIYNFDDLSCTNEACISHPSQCEGVPALFYRTEGNRFICAYCGKRHSFKEIWSSKQK